MAVRLSALRADRSLTPGRFLVLISLKGCVDPHGHSAAGRIRSIEKSSDLFKNRTRHLPAGRDVNTEAEEATALEAVMRRQPVKTQQTEKTQYVL
jgi:hypothetical protein